ncbi:hypothetical protein ES703_63320 [subsurface metagenome]
MNKMTVDYEQAVKDLKTESDIKSVAIIEGKYKIVYSTEDWDISEDIRKLVGIWDSMHGKSLTLSDKKYSILQSTPERLVATSIKGKGHILGAKDDERKVIVYAKPKGNMLTAYTAAAKALKVMSSKKPYMDEKTELGKMEQFPPEWDTPRLREQMMKGLIEFFTLGGKLEKPDEIDIKRREKERGQRMEELSKVLHALEITKEERNKLVSITIKSKFVTDYIYDDFQLLRVKHKIEKLIEKEFQVHDIETRIVKKI